MGTKGKQQKRKPDIALKEYWREEEHFADLYNAVLFSGKQVILPEDLAEGDADVSHVLEHGRAVANIKAFRDIIKIVKRSKKYGVTLAILGIENQENIHYAMPLRVMEYDAYSYKKQYDELAKQYVDSADRTEDERLSRMRKTDKLAPVITIVIYYGEKPWNGAKSLKEMLELPAGVEAYVSDYPMHLVEIRSDSLELQNEDNINLFQICRMIYNHTKSLAEGKRQVIDYVEKNEVKEEVLKAVGAAVGKQIRWSKKEENKNMCTFFDELEKECRLEGEKIGEKRGIKRGREEGMLKNAVKVVKNAMQKYKLSLEEACELAEISVETYEKYVNMA